MGLRIACRLRDAPSAQSPHARAPPGNRRSFVQLFAAGELEPGVSARLACDCAGANARGQHARNPGRPDLRWTMPTLSREHRRFPRHGVGFVVPYLTSGPPRPGTHPGRSLFPISPPGIAPHLLPCRIRPTIYNTPAPNLSCACLEIRYLSHTFRSPFPRSRPPSTHISDARHASYRKKGS